MIKHRTLGSNFTNFERMGLDSQDDLDELIEANDKERIVAELWRLSGIVMFAKFLRQGWMVEQFNFITGVRSRNEQDLRKNLKLFQVPEASIESIRSKLDMRIFDESTNILKCMYSTRFNGCTSRSGTSTEVHSTPDTTKPSLISTLEIGRPDKFGKRISLVEGNKEASDK